MVFSKCILLVAGLATVVACGGMSTTGDPDHWHAKVYRGTEGKVGEQKSVAHTSATKLSESRTRVSVSLPGLIFARPILMRPDSECCHITLVVLLWLGLMLVVGLLGLTRLVIEVERER